VRVGPLRLILVNARQEANMPNSGDVFEVGEILKVIEIRLASINANWNGQGPDLMSPAQLAAFKSEIFSFAQGANELAFAVGEYAARIRSAKTAGA